MSLLFISSWDDKGAWRKRLLAIEPDLDFRVWPDDVGDPAKVEAAMVWKPPEGVLASFPNLKAILSLGMGVDHVFADAKLPRHVPVARMFDRDLIDRMSEYCVHAVLHYHRSRDVTDAQQRAGKWKVIWPEPHASERRVGILGVGAIGGDVAAKLRPFGFRLAGWSRSPKDLPGVDSFVGDEGLLPFLARSEIVICLLPLTPQTHDLLDARAFAAMPKGAVLVNVARGGHVVEADLIAALDSGQLAAAQLDVFRVEPLPAGHPFWTHPKIRVTPHNAGITNPDSAAQQILANYRRARAGEPLKNQVDPARGY